MEKNLVDVAVAIITNSRKEFLLQKKDLRYIWFPGKWCLFGGGIKSGELPEQALLRELKEELKYNFKDSVFLGRRNYEDVANGRIRGGTSHIYEIKFPGEISGLSLREGAGLAFFDISELESQNLVRHDLDFILEFYH